VIGQFRKVCRYGVEPGNFADHTREPLLLLEEVVKAEGVAFGTFAVYAHARLFHAECHDQDDHQYREGNG